MEEFRTRGFTPWSKMDTTSLSLDLDQHHASRWQARCCASVEIVKDRMELEQVDSAY